MISYCISLGQVPISCSSASTLPVPPLPAGLSGLSVGSRSVCPAPILSVPPHPHMPCPLSA